MTINQLLQGKATRIKDNTFLPTEAYVTPFIERMQTLTSDFIINVKTPTQISITGEEDDHIYNRVWIQAVLPNELNFPNHREAIHMLYALDTRSPAVKFARTAINGACLNQCIFNPSLLNISEFSPNSSINFKGLDTILETSDDIVNTLRRYSETVIDYNIPRIKNMLGTWGMRMFDPEVNQINRGFGKVKLATSIALEAYKLLYVDETSPYWVKPGTPTTLFNIYNAWTEIVSHDARDVYNPIEKTLIIRNIIDPV